MSQWNYAEVWESVAGALGDKPALIQGDRVVTWSQFDGHLYSLLLPFFAIIPVVESLSVIAQLTSKKFRGKKIFHSTPIHPPPRACGVD